MHMLWNDWNLIAATFPLVIGVEFLNETENSVVLLFQGSGGSTGRAEFTLRTGMQLTTVHVHLCCMCLIIMVSLKVLRPQSLLRLSHLHVSCMLINSVALLIVGLC